MVQEVGFAMLRDLGDPLAPPAGRRRHFFLADSFLAISVGGERWNSGDRGDR
jgi:hypothetical protein